MALVPCPECQKEVSTEARACPQCAFPFPGKKGVRENPSAASLSACPKCDGPVSTHARACPHCGISFIGGGEPQRKTGDLFQETLQCPHCGLSYTRTMEEGAGFSETMTSVKRMSNGETTEIPVGQAGSPLYDPAQQGSRRRLPLWQDSPAAKKITAPRRSHRSKKHSVIIGLLLLVIIALSVFFGAIWQLEGLTPVEALFSWSM